MEKSRGSGPHDHRGRARGPWALAVAGCLLITTGLVGVGLPGGVAGATPLDWSITPTPSPSRGSLASVSCTDPSNCVAVGSVPLLSGSLIEAWDGNSWTVVPNPDSSVGYLSGVWCGSPTDCVAVGTGASGSAIESWDGTEWSVVPSPVDGSLLGVSCTGPQSCVAVGFQYVNDWSQTTAESWNGTAWSIVPSPNPGTGNEGGGTNKLTSVSCTSPTNCVAVGDYADESYAVSGPSQTLVEAWDGTQWSVVASPDTGTQGNALTGVTCVDADDCIAVGRATAGYQTDTLVESWDGTAWTTVPSPGEGQLNAVTCTSGSDCVAVGGAYGDESVHSTLVESWNGSAWSTTASPDDGTYSNDLYGVTCTSSSACQAVGTFESGDKYLILAGSDIPAPTITEVKPPKGKVGTKVTIMGTNLASAQVTFNGVSAAPLTDIATEITLRVPAGATTGYIQIRTGGGFVSSKQKFKVKKP